MPFINVHIGKQISEEKKKEVYDMIASNMPILPGKTRDNTFVEISAGRDMYTRGEKTALLFVDMRVYHESPFEAKKEFVETLSKGFEEILGIPAGDQGYNIMEQPCWGSRGTFRN